MRYHFSSPTSAKWLVGETEAELPTYSSEGRFKDAHRGKGGVGGVFLLPTLGPLEAIEGSLCSVLIGDWHFRIMSCDTTSSRTRRTGEETNGDKQVHINKHIAAYRWQKLAEMQGLDRWDQSTSGRNKNYRPPPRPRSPPACSSAPAAPTQRGAGAPSLGGAREGRGKGVSLVSAPDSSNTKIAPPPLGVEDGVG